MAIIYGIPDSERRLSKLPYKSIPLSRGAKGESKVLKKLSELDNGYHVLCDVRVDLGRLVTYRNKKKIRKATMDFVVVSKRGVVIIEAKNWSDEFQLKYIKYTKKYGGITPHEQVDGYGLVLFVELNPRGSTKKIQVTQVLLATSGNMQYDPAYSTVNVKNLNNINFFIQNKGTQFSDEEVKEIIDRLRWCRHNIKSLFT